MSSIIDTQVNAFLVMMLKANAPFDTGRLSNVGIRLDAKDGHIVIGHDYDRTLADYAIYTEEKWSNGQNPNEHWIENTLEQAKPYIQQIYQGMAIEDYDALMDEMQLKYVEHARAKGGIKKEFADEFKGAR